MAAEVLSTLLYQAAGVTTAPDRDSLFPRSFRAAPSAGAMYPIDLFVHATSVSGVQNGIYHYDAHAHGLRTVHGESCARELSAALVQPQLAHTSGAIVMMAATFERATQKYRERGFRFALIEAGHIGQNLLLTAHSLGLSGIPLGGYYDRRIDDLLGLDGVTHSVIYCIAVGLAGQGRSDLLHGA